MADTPEVLATYAKQYGAGDHWTFLTGPKPAVYSLAQTGFKVPLAEDAAATDRIIHSTRFALVDRQGTVRATYEGTTVDLRMLNGDIQRLKAEPAQP